MRKRAAWLEAQEAKELSSIELRRRQASLEESIATSAGSQKMRELIEDLLTETGSGENSVLRQAVEIQQELSRVELEKWKARIEIGVLDERTMNGFSQEGLDLLMSTIPRWKHRRDLGLDLSSYQFFQEFWQPHFQSGLVSQRELRLVDTPLYNALNSFARTNGTAISVIAPPRQPQIAA